MLPAVLATSAIVFTPHVFAHGEADESVAEFHEHLDDYRSEIEAFLADVDPIVEQYRAGGDVLPMIDGLIDRWEDMPVHGAIETHAAPTYAGIWQAMVALQQAAQEGASDRAVASAADRVSAALWQGFGALRLAAAQVDSDADGHDPAAHGRSEASAATVDRIVAGLDDAVAAYRDGDAARAETLVEDAYMNGFEYLEGELTQTDSDLTRKLETHFNATLPLLMQDGASIDKVSDAIAQMKSQLERARTLLVEAEQTRS
jgi:hypothetical protein